MAVTALPAGGGVLMGLNDHRAVIFDACSGDLLHTLLHDGVVGSVAVAAQGGFALTGSDDETARRWNVQNGKIIDRWDMKARKSMHATGAAIVVVGLKSNRQYFALAGDGRLVQLTP